MKFRPTPSIALLTIEFVLSGCAALNADDGAGRADLAKFEVEKDKKQTSIPIVSRSQAAWLMGTAVQISGPPSPLLAQHITYSPREPVTLTEVATYVAQTTGFTLDTSQISSAVASPAAETGEQLVSTNAPQIPQAEPRFAVKYEGPLQGLLDAAAARFGAVWVLSGNHAAILYPTGTTHRSNTAAMPPPSASGSAAGNGTDPKADGPANSERQVGHVTNPGANNLQYREVTPEEVTPEQWDARTGTTLRSEITRWADKAGWKVIYDTKTDYPIVADLQFTGTFDQATANFIRLYDRAEKPLVADISIKQRVIYITARKQS